MVKGMKLFFVCELPMCACLYPLMDITQALLVVDFFYLLVITALNVSSPSKPTLNTSRLTSECTDLTTTKMNWC